MLQTKLHIPQKVDHIVPRDQLSEKLSEGYKRKLILVSAPAGFGKTTAVANWIVKYKIPAAWFSIDISNNDPVDFLEYIILSIQTLKPDFGEKANQLLKSPDPPRFELVINLLVNDIIQFQDHFLLVLDDYHLITEPAINQLISYLLEKIPDNIHIAITSRSDPNLPLSKLRSKHQLVEIRSSDLSFTVVDIALLLNKHYKLRLSEVEIKTLEKKTEGWIAGLQLVALSLQWVEDKQGFVSSFAGNNRYIMDYLIEEVVRNQPEPIRQFLLKASLLKQLSAPLCNYVLEIKTSQSIIEELEKNNVFVFPLDYERGWYRFHQLFADLLKQRLMLEQPEIVWSIHQRASQWFEQNQMTEMAIEHTIELKDFEKALELIDRIAENLWHSGHFKTLEYYGNMLPENLAFESHSFCLYRGWSLISTGKIEEAKNILSKTEELINQSNEKDKLLPKLAVAMAYMHSYEDHSDRALEYCSKALSGLNEGEHVWFVWLWYAYGIAIYSKGNVEESTKAYQKALHYAKISGNIKLMSTLVIRMSDNEQQMGRYKKAFEQCMNLLSFMQDQGFSQLTRSDWSFAGIYSTIAVSYIIWGELDKATEYIKIAYDLSVDSDDLILRAFLLMFYVGINQALGNKLEMYEKAKKLDEILRTHKLPPYLEYSYLSWKIYDLLTYNKVEEAHNLLVSSGLDPLAPKNPVNDSAYAFYARVLIAQGKYDESEKMLSELYELAKQTNRTERLIDLKMIYARLFQYLGEHQNAIQATIEAVEMASADNMVMFIAYNADFNFLLFEEVFKTLATDNKHRIPNYFIKNLQVAIERKKNQIAAKSEPILSDREVDVLQLIAKKNSNQQIADQLYISLNTVKTHLKSIYLKLDVNDRIKAIEKANELNIL